MRRETAGAWLGITTNEYASALTCFPVRAAQVGNLDLAKAQFFFNVLFHNLLQFKGH
jgi:hypothetical protein